MQKPLVVVSDETTQICLGRFITRQLKGDLMWITRHAQRSGQSIEPADVLIGHLPPRLGESSVLEDIHVVIVIEEDHGANRHSHSWSIAHPAGHIHASAPELQVGAAK
ncbi:hypothetical protein NFX46_19520 [Streptomyces phaeoluteigriseus]|uniref:Uncharacterized protein n=1 Tax=Streptomyces phaeoluteigriseus TaxID=114686 RepID=A0ABY4ZLJ9_9ACTN|nr:hypothetical protein [Streptomyces phaeoluteigriseus]USQ89856.1 hypothetical protein NFX46_19520 [Streptomyces phaeoluteigriseus]